MSNKPDNYIAGLVRELAKLPTETEWVEFKHNNADPMRLPSTSLQSVTLQPCVQSRRAPLSGE